MGDSDFLSVKPVILKYYINTHTHTHKSILLYTFVNFFLFWKTVIFINI